MKTVEQLAWERFVRGPSVTHDENCKCPFCERRAANTKRLDELGLREYPDTFVRILEIQTEQAKLITELRTQVADLSIKQIRLPINWFGRLLTWLSSI
jgi:hypothetical protein